MAHLIAWLLVAATAATTLLAVAVSAEKWRRTRSEGRRRRVEADFRPQLIEWLASEGAQGDGLIDNRSRSDGVASAIDDLAIGMMSKLRGEDRRLLRDLLERRNAFVRAIAETRSIFAVRRARAVELLGDGEVRAALPEMTRLLDDRSLEVRKAAARALGKLGEPISVTVLIRALAQRQVPASVVGMAILHIGMSASDPLGASLSAPEPRERALAADCLGALGALGAVPGLVQLVGREADPGVLRPAIRALGRIGSPDGIAVLTSVLGSAVDPEVRAEAVAALGWIGGDAARSGVEGALGDGKALVLRAATKSLRRLGPAGVERLREVAATDGPQGAFAREALDASAVELSARRAA
ncbi:MAG: HEAT repeat domain-containing protein [Actinomycetia bacterium]|nr:HEAT repeat domain-containing protein [Actinomycetes bacterium]